MNYHSFINESGEEIQSYNAVNLTIKTFIEIIKDMSAKNSIAGGYMVRHSKFKGISYNSDDEYVDQFITLYVPSKKEKIESSDDVHNKDENDKYNSSQNEEVAEEDIHEFSFDTKYSMDTNNRIFCIYDPGTGNRIALNSILNMLNKVVTENDESYNYIMKYRDDSRICNINDVWVNSIKKSVKFY